MRVIKRIFLFSLFVFFFLPFFPARAGVIDEIDQRNRQIEEIQRQIDEYQRQIEETGSKARTLANEVGQLNARISKVQLEIKSLGLAIEQTKLEIISTQEQVQLAQQQIELQKAALAQYLKVLNQTDRQNLTSLIFKNARLSDFFNSLKSLRDLQEKVKSAIVAIKELKANLEDKKSDLESKQEDLENLKSLQVAEKRNLDSDKGTKDRLLKETKGQEARYQQLVKQSQQDIERIRDQIFYLQQNGVTVEDAIKFGQLAALRVSIRPAFLIAILEVESGLGRNVGTGNWLNDMYNCYRKLGKVSRAETEKAAFFSIVTKLNLNPDTVKVSREPNYGCGGALGPAQFLPSVWLAYEEEVTRLTNHNPPSPWSIEDAFMASAIKLDKAGAAQKTKTGESRAARAYISGNPNCTKRICSYYVNAVLNKATVIEQNL